MNEQKPAILLIAFSCILFTGCLGSTPGGSSTDTTWVATPTTAFHLMPTTTANSNAASIASCQGLDKAPRDTCLMAVAYQTSDPTVCKYVSAPLVDECYTTYAAVSKDASACGQIKGTLIASVCYTQVAYENNDSTLCSKANENLPIGGQTDYGYADCLSKVAVEEANSSLCPQGIVYPALNLYCVPSANDNYSACAGNQNCIQEVSALNNNATGCNTLSAIELKDSCITQVAGQLNQTKLCDLTSTPSDQANCQEHVWFVNSFPYKQAPRS